MPTIDELFPSNYLKAADLGDKTFKAKIDKIVFEEIGQDKQKKPILYFAGVRKGLVMNKTNGTAIAEMHGKSTEGWTGKEVELFSRMVPFQGQDVPAIRVRAVADAEPTLAGLGDPDDAISI